jgi:hypothetical protein
MGSDELVHFAFVAVTPATGDIVYDTFDGKLASPANVKAADGLADNYMRSEIEVSY